MVEFMRSEWTARWAGRHRVDSNPLRRRSDRLETIALAVAAGLVVLSLWPAMVVAEVVTDRGRADSVHKQQVSATLLEDAPVTPVSFGELAAPMPEVRASWLTPASAEQTGWISVVPGTRAGTVTEIWIDGAGMRVSAPPRDADIRLRGIHAGAFVVLSIALALTAVLAGLRAVLNRRRYADWDRAWQLVSTGRST